MQQYAERGALLLAFGETPDVGGRDAKLHRRICELEFCTFARVWDLLALIMIKSNFDFIRVNDLTLNEVVASLAESKKILIL